MIYLASPYSHPDWMVRDRRYQEVMEFCAIEMSFGTTIFSPIAYGHFFSILHGTPTDHKTWQRFNDHMLFNSTAVWVLKLGGWEQSKGIAAEIRLARDLKKKITFREPYRAEIQQSEPRRVDDAGDVPGPGV